MSELTVHIKAICGVIVHIHCSEWIVIITQLCVIIGTC